MTDNKKEEQPTAVLELIQICASYGDGKVLSDVSLFVENGSCHAVIGPSGSGKSTLLKCATLLHPVDTGKIRFQDNEIAANGHICINPDTFRSRVGLVHQEWNLWSNKTVLENVVEAPRFVLSLAKNEARDRAKHWLDKTGIGELGKRYPHELSGGQKQRVALARALVMEPIVLLLDEITSALDVETTAKLLSVFESLRNDGLTLVFVAHHLNFVEMATETTTVLIGGKVTESGNSKSVLNAPCDARTEAFLSVLRKVR